MSVFFRHALTAAQVIGCTLVLGACGVLGDGEAPAPPDRGSDSPSSALLSYEDTSLFLNGGNVAWNQFARDVGPHPDHPERATFADLFQQVNTHRGNTLRLWLHTNGAHTPAWDDSTVVGPGTHTIRDLRSLLDAAQRRNVGMILCLWSFDMLRTSYGPDITNRAHALLTEREKTESYVHNALVPMVEALGDHPALLAWEIFNEPAGMSKAFGWDGTRHVPFTDLQRFVNLAAGAIHRTNADALVTSGAWSFSVLTDTALPKGRDFPRAKALPPSQVRPLQHHLAQQ